VAEVRLDATELRRLMSSPDGPVYAWMTRTGNAVKRQAQQNLRLGPTRAFDTGNLRNSISEEIALVNGSPVLRVGTNVPYALAVHQGGPINVRAHTVKSHTVKAHTRTVRGRTQIVRSHTVKAHSVRAHQTWRNVGGRPFLTKALTDLGYRTR